MSAWRHGLFSARASIRASGGQSDCVQSDKDHGRQEAFQRQAACDVFGEGEHLEEEEAIAPGTRGESRARSRRENEGPGAIGSHKKGEPEEDVREEGRACEQERRVEEDRSGEQERSGEKAGSRQENPQTSSRGFGPASGRARHRSGQEGSESQKAQCESDSPA